MGHLFDAYSSISSRLVTYGLGRYRPKTTISTAIALVTLYMVYKSLQPPARLKHIPHIHIFTYLGAFLSGKSLNYVARNVVMPTAMKAENGLYAVCRCSWHDFRIVPLCCCKRLCLDIDVD